MLRGVAGVEVDRSRRRRLRRREVRLRGANPGETLVLIDGVRIGNTTATDGSLDFGNLAIVDIDRIEILRGPQSALYGSDAMGGVINIITRKGAGKTPKRTVTVEAGSYGTLSTRATHVGRRRRWTYSLGVNLLHSRRVSPLRLSHRPAADRSAAGDAAAAAARPTIRPTRAGRADASPTSCPTP